MTKRALGLAALAATTVSLWAQSPAPLRADRAGEAVSPDHALAAWRDAHG